MISIRFPFLPQRRSLWSNQVCDLFGLSDEEPPITIAENFSLDLQPGQIALFHGPSGSGKSSLLRTLGQSWNAQDAQQILLPDIPLIDALEGSLEKRLGELSACGLGEARLMLRTPSELSEGQRFRFRLAYAMSLSQTVMVDEFSAVLDRTLAKVVAYNLRKQVQRWKGRLLLATSHEDVLEDLQPDVRVECRGDGDIRIFRSENRVSKPISFADELKIREGTLADWKYFARWHYRSRTVAFVRRVVVLEHLHQPIGICIFCCPAASLTLRTRYFGLQRPQSPRMMQRMNKSLWVLSRVVLHPTYRGAGIAARFIAEACDSCPVEWIETLSAMGRVNPVFEKAGFQKIGLIRRNGKRPSRAYKNRKSNKNPNEDRQNQFSEPVYFIRKTFRGPTRG